MTIGIGAAGPNAGLAVFRALHAAERVATGSIGGFAVFAAISRDGRLLRAQTQRGGTATLFTNGETTGTAPPEDFAAAPFAGIISSGPDRPEPISLFVAADPGIGIVTGHRLPITPGVSGVPLNEDVLAAMGSGASADEALSAVLSANSDRDAGMIALGPGKGIAALDSRFVARRTDLGSARRSKGGAAVEVLLNAISPGASLAALVADLAVGVMSPDAVPAGEISVRAGTPLVGATAHCVVLDDSHAVVRIETDIAYLLTGKWNCAALSLGAAVVRNGKMIGRTLVEPNVTVVDGRIVSLSGKEQVSIPYAAAKGVQT